MTPAPHPGLYFVDATLETAFPDSRYLIVPRGLRHRQQLFDWFVDACHFPKYFGRNWDAFEECLHALDGLPDQPPIVLYHDELPFGPGHQHRTTYTAILADVAARWAQEPTGPRLRVAFPTRLEPLVRTVLMR